MTSVITRPTIVLLVGLIAMVSAGWAARAGEAEDIFRRRIMPIFKSPNPSSCTQCHLAGVDLKDYILPSHEQMFVSLRDQGLVDLDRPASSKILQLIAMEPGRAAGARLIDPKVRAAERDAFAAWIEASARDPRLRDAPKLRPAQLAKPARPDPVIRHAREDRLLESFTRNVWSQQFRCAHCHSPQGNNNAKFAAKHGPGMAWIRPEGALATMNHLIEHRLVDPKEPAKSLLLLKPTLGVEHDGGKKMNRGDSDYMAFLAWVEDYAAVVGDKYKDARDLPGGPDTFGTEVWLRAAKVPPDWAGRLVRMTVHAPAGPAAGAGWEAEPVAVVTATAERGKKDGKTFAHMFLRLQAAPGSERSRGWRDVLAAGRTPSLAPGRYQVKVFVRRGPAGGPDVAAAIGEAEFVGQTEVRSEWRAGYKDATEFDAARLAR